MIIQKNMKEILAESLMDLTSRFSYKSITVKQIAENCNTTTRTFYNHFLDKNDLVGWIYNKTVIESTCAIKDYVDWRSSMLNLLHRIYENRDYFCNVSTYQGQNSLLQTMHEVMMEKYLQYACTLENTEALNDNVKFVINFFSWGSCTQINLWVKNDMDCPPEILLEKLELCIPAIISDYFSIGQSEPGL